MKAQLIRKVSLAALLGFAAFAATATEWKYYAAGAEGNPTTVACITDDNWVLQVKELNASTGTITFEAKAENGDYKACIERGEGVLDLRGTVVTVDGVAYGKKIFSTSFARAYKGITEFYADNVTSFGSRAFQSCTTITTASVVGTFPSIGEFCFSGCSALTSVVLNSKSLASIGGTAFQEAHLLTAIDITSDIEVTVAVSAMNWKRGYLTSLTINSPVAWSSTNIDRLLKGQQTYSSGSGVPERDGTTEETADKLCTIYADKGIWSSLAATLTDAETAVKPKKCFGVYREGSRKAWLVANNADPVPFRIIIR